jgi:hypothetical protein
VLQLLSIKIIDCKGLSTRVFAFHERIESGAGTAAVLVRVWRWRIAKAHVSPLHGVARVSSPGAPATATASWRWRRTLAKIAGLGRRTAPGNNRPVGMTAALA